MWYFYLWAGGLMYKLPESNLQYVTSITFLLTTYSKYMSAKKHTFNCGNVLVTPNTLRSIAKRQVSLITCTTVSWILSIPWLTKKKYCKISGWLHIRCKPNKNVLHGRLWSLLSQESSPQRIFLAFNRSSSTNHRLWWRFQPVFPFNES